MDHNVSTFDYPASTVQDNLNFQNGIPATSNFEVWGNGYSSYTLQDQMAWLSSNGSILPTTEYGTMMPQSFTDPALQQTSRYQPQMDMMSSTTYPPQMYGTTDSPAPAHQTLDAMIPLDGSTVDRPQSACTGLDSAASSNRSRSSSNSSSPLSRASKFKVNKVPTIKTQFENKGHAISLNNTPLGDGFQVAPDTDGMTAMSSEWMQIHDTSGQHNLHDPTLSAASIKANSALLEPFMWESPITRRTSLSSATSGPVFSPYGTPASTMWQQSALSSPYFQQPNWTPVSGTNRFSPQSPHQPKSYGTWNRAQYFNALRQNRNGKQTAMSLPNRRPPQMRRNITDSYIGSHSTPTSQSRARSNDNRAARNDNVSQPSSAVSQQLALPEFGTIFASPDLTSTEFQTAGDIHTPVRNVLPSSSTTQTPMAPPLSTQRVGLTPGFNSLNMSNPYGGTQSFPQLPTNVPSTPSNATPIPTPAHQPPLPIPSEPPLSDFLVNTSSTGCTSTTHDGHSHSHPPACGPIRQSPHFEGDIYTPRYKRRNAAGKWEGWCGYCQPGRWLDLKNSRYWEDKLRNHGICARTKTFFDGPVRVRWVSDRGTIWEGEAGDSGFDLAGQEGVEDDGVGRKREGLCGECNQWVGMDGMRSRGKGRCVAWWMHAYKCHEQSRSRTDGTGNFEQS